MYHDVLRPLNTLFERLFHFQFQRTRLRTEDEPKRSRRGLDLEHMGSVGPVVGLDVDGLDAVVVTRLDGHRDGVGRALKRTID